MIRHAVEPRTPPLGKCSKHDCEMLQRYDICSQHTSAELLFMEGKKMYTLYAYGDSVKKLAGIDSDEIVTEETLLHIPKFSKVHFNANNVVTKVEH